MTGTDIMVEFSGGGPLDGIQLSDEDWPADTPLPGTQIIDKSGAIYRYLLTASVTHPVYTFRGMMAVGTEGF